MIEIAVLYCLVAVGAFGFFGAALRRDKGRRMIGAALMLAIIWPFSLGAWIGS